MAELVKAAEATLATQEERDVSSVTEVGGVSVHLHGCKELQVEDLVSGLSDRDQIPEAGINKLQVTERVVDRVSEIFLNELEEGTDDIIPKVEEADCTRVAVAEVRNAGVL